MTVKNWEKGKVPKGISGLLDYLLSTQTEPGGIAYQLSLPFDPPLNLELKIAPKEPHSVRLELNRMDRAG